MSSDTAPAAATGLPPTDYAAALLPAADLAKLSNAELSYVANLLRGACDAFAYSTSAKVLERFNDVLIDALGNIADLVEHRMPTSPAEANWRGWLLASHAAFVSADLATMADHMSEACALHRDLSRQSR